jgi:hypothetical protein
MKKNTLGYQGKLSREDFENILRKTKEFRNFDKWKIKTLNIGEMTHTYILQKGKKKYFSKEVKLHEAQVNYFLYKLKLRHLPYSLFPKLLKKGILIMPNIDGKMLRKKQLDINLLKDFIKFQNKMNNRAYFEKHNTTKLNNYSQSEDGFFAKNLYDNFKECKKNLLKLKKKYKLKIIQDFLELLNLISINKEGIIKDFVSMPFTRQHHDFREDNIIVNNGGQFLIDWGSSYGYGPFMYDYAEFLVDNQKALNIVINKSKICKNICLITIERWLYVSLIAKMLNMLRWYIQKGHHNIETKKNVKKLLEHEYKTYKVLLKLNDI